MLAEAIDRLMGGTVNMLVRGPASVLGSHRVDNKEAAPDFMAVRITRAKAA